VVTCHIGPAIPVDAGFFIFGAPKNEPCLVFRRWLKRLSFLDPISGAKIMHTRRYNWLFIFLLAIIASVHFSGCSSESKMPRLGSDAVIVAFGDSITFGTGAQPQDSYPAVLEKMINRRVVNAGIPGEVTSQGLSRLPEVLEREKPALLILCEGGNDMLRRLNEQQMAGNLRDMIRLAQSKKVAVVLIAVPQLGILVSPAPVYEKIAKEMSILLEEKTLSTILADSSQKSDYIHPNAAGYQRLAEAIAALLKKKGAID
jgi:acyl-CoA thioesterase I